VSTHERSQHFLTIYRSHGKFRPSLKGLVQQNSEEFVEATTSEGFSAASWPESLNTLVKLKGIGPATAALLLSTNNPEELPFFSDELFRWAFWDDVPGSRWDRKIKYSLKEYRDLVARVDELRDRIGKSALEAEKVAYVLGKKETSLGKSVPRDEDENTATESVDGEPPKRSGTKGNARKTPAPTKRKVAESEPEIQKEDASQPTKKKKKSSVPTTSSRVTRSSKSIQAKNS
jgi:hypothetical protein